MKSNDFLSSGSRDQKYFHKKTLRKNFDNILVSYGIFLIVIKESIQHSVTWLECTECIELNHSLFFHFCYSEPPEIESKSEVVVKLGDHVELECSCSNCLPVTAKWNYDRKKRQHSSKDFEDEENDSFKTILIIDDAQKQDEKDYECELSNSFEKRKKKIYVITQIKPHSITIIAKGSSLKSVDKIVKIVKAEDTLLKCVAKGYPIPKITWFKDGTHIGNNSISLKKDHMSEHSGSYECRVENSLGSVSKVIEVTVQIATSGKEPKERLVMADEKQNVKLNCEVTGVPEPAITWTFNKKQLPASKKYNLLNQDQALEFEAQHDSFGTYSCFGQNKYGKAAIKFTVFVRGKISVIFAIKWIL